MRRGNNKNVLVLVGGMHIATHHGVARAARDFGWYLDLGFIEGARLPEGFNGDGILCALTDDPKMEMLVKGANVPVVDISMNRTDIELPRVVADNKGIGKTAAEHFLQYGHKHFAWFSFERDAVSLLRLEGFQERLGETIIRLDGSFSRSRTRMAEKLKTLPKPCAILARRDSDAAWLLSLCVEEGYDVPGEIAVLGVDNNTLICEYLQVPLSSVNHNLELLGYDAAQMLNQMMNGAPAPLSVQLIPPQGVTARASTDSFAVLDDAVREALVFMKENLSDSMGTQEIADEVGLNKRALEIRFKEAMGQTVHEKMIEFRLLEAERMLRMTSDSVEDISAQCGFCHAQHLSRLFKSHFGQPPLRYRKTLS